MKKILFFVISAGLLTACRDNPDYNNGAASSTSKSNTEAVQDTTIPYIKFNDKNFAAAQPYDTVVNETLATGCIDEMGRVFSVTSDATLKAAYTKSVKFGSKALRDWLIQYDILEKSDSLSISFGMYTQDAIDELKLDQKYLNRVTVFIWPYKLESNGSLSSLTKPFNIGSLHP